MSAQRFLTREKAALEVYGKTGTAIANLKNISSTGACLELLQQEGVNLQQGDILRLTVFLKTLGRKHNVSAEVIWSNGKSSGISFLKPDQVLERITEKT